MWCAVLSTINCVLFLVIYTLCFSKSGHLSVPISSLAFDSESVNYISECPYVDICV